MKITKLSVRHFLTQRMVSVNKFYHIIEKKPVRVFLKKFLSFNVRLSFQLDINFFFNPDAEEQNVTMDTTQELDTTQEMAEETPGKKQKKKKKKAKDTE